MNATTWPSTSTALAWSTREAPLVEEHPEAHARDVVA